MPRLDEVHQEISEDPFWDHLRVPGIRMVPGFGPTRPRVMIVGEAPGATENARGRPFCGPSGAVLEQLMAVAGLQAEDRPWGTGSNPAEPAGVDPANAYLTNVVKYRPPGNRTPSLPEIMHARDGFRQERVSAGFKKTLDTSLPEGAGSLRREWQALGGPRLIVCVGSVAHTALHPCNWESLSNWVGRPVTKHLASPTQEGGLGGYWFVSQYHPAYGMRRPNMQGPMERDWEELGEFINKEGLI
jgi:uracil-DNA glycosylase